MSARKTTPCLVENARGIRPIKKRGVAKEPQHLVVIRLPWLHEIRRRPQPCVPPPMSDPPRAYAPLPTLAGDHDGRR